MRESIWLRLEDGLVGYPPKRGDVISVVRLRIGIHVLIIITLMHILGRTCKQTVFFAIALIVLFLTAQVGGVDVVDGCLLLRKGSSRGLGAPPTCVRVPNAQTGGDDFVADTRQRR